MLELRVEDFENMEARGNRSDGALELVRDAETLKLAIHRLRNGPHLPLQSPSITSNSLPRLDTGSDFDRYRTKRTKG